ncbi:MAG: hypothetical protein KY466_02265 [Gemmatimonadetes bacterium]|nr:hypothetical protein [Gemmatimonadota bacterium]
MREENRRPSPEDGRTSAPRLWPWAVAFIMAALAVWFAVTVVERSGPPVPGEPAARPAATLAPDTGEGDPREPVPGAVAGEVMERAEEMRAAVRRYEEGCAARLEPAAGRGLGALVSECIDRLGRAIDAIVATDTVGAVVIDERLATWRRSVRDLESRPPDDARAATTRSALISAAETLNTVSEERYTESLEPSEGPDLVEAAAAIEADRPLLDQQERVRRFFLRAGAVLSAMARPGDPGPEPD